MANVNKIIGSLATAINKVTGSVISGLSKIMGATISLFTDTQCAAKSFTTGTANAVYITDSDVISMVSKGILDKPSASLLDVPGTYCISKSKAARAASHR